MKNKFHAAYVLDYEFGAATNEFYSVLWGEGALVVHVVGVVGHVPRRPVVYNPTPYPPSPAIVLTE